MRHFLLYLAGVCVGGSLLSQVGIGWLGRKFQEAVQQSGLEGELRRYRGLKADWTALLYIRPYTDTPSAKALTELRLAKVNWIVWTCRVWVFSIACFGMSLLLLAFTVNEAVAEIIVWGLLPLPVLLGAIHFRGMSAGLKRLKADLRANELKEIDDATFHRD